jgi:hypothetical protein
MRDEARSAFYSGVGVRQTSLKITLGSLLGHRHEDDRHADRMDIGF